MIVICTKCQAKFRVADDKIGPRGAKVRCSKCQTVFLVHPVLGTVPVTDGDARHVARSPPPPAPAAAPEPAADPFAAGDPFAAPPPAADPFGPPRDDPFAPPASPAADPFGGADPFAAAPPPAAGATGLGDPFVAAVSHRSTLPVTDLSDLMGAPAPAGPPPLPAARAAPAPAPATAPMEDPFSAPAPAAPQPSSEPALEAAFGAPPTAAPEPALADPFASEDPFAAGAAPPPLPGAAGEPSGPAPAEGEPDLELAAPSAGPSLDDGGLALEDRLTPPPSRIATPSSAAPPPDPTLETAAPAPAGGGGPDPFAAFGAAPAGGAGEPFDPGAFDFGNGGAGDLGGPEPDLAEPSQARTPPPQPPPRAPAPDAARPAAAGAAAVAPPAAAAGATSIPALGGGEAADRIPGGRTSRLRTVAVNAIALFAVIVVALAIWAVWRTDGPLEAASLRPSAILAALGRGGATGPWTAQDVRSGVYDRVRGAPLLFVRGRVVSRATAPVPRVKVAVQVVRGGQVLARGEALAGAVPTEEDLYLAADDAAIAGVRRAAEARAPAAVRPGDAVPFLVAIGDAPPDLQGATLRIDVAPAGGAAP